MLEIVRDRSWSQYHTVLDNEDGPLSDLSLIILWKCQIREKFATKNAKGFFENKLITDVTITEEESVLHTTLTREQTSKLHNGDYLIDIIGTYADLTDESFLDPEPVRVTNRPTLP